MSSYLSNEQLYELIKAAMDADLTTPGVRDSLLMGINRGYVNRLPVRESPLDQLCSNLVHMNSTSYLAGSNEVPLRIWLENATHHLRITGRPEVALLQRLLDEVTAKSVTVIAQSSDAQNPSASSEADYDACATALHEAYATHVHAKEYRLPSISITGNGNVVGDHNTVFVTINQRYPLLSDYAYDVGKTIAAETEWFTGRTFVFEWLETQLRTLPCGYLRLIADAGLGKTAIAAEVARRYNAVIHFINAAAGITRTDQCLNALAVQLIARYGLKHDHLPERAGLDSDFLQTLLQEAAAARDDAPILLVIDALDEVDASTPGHNWLHLPQQLPQGVFILLTHRPGDYPVAVGPQLPQSEPLRINWDDATQQQDIEAHLRRQAVRPELQRALASATPPIAVDTFVQALQGAAEGNFMYLAYVLADIARREPGFDPLNLQALPRGLDGYYGQFWAQMEQVKGQDGWAEWKNLYRPVIELLGVAGEPVTAEWLASQTGREAEEITERALARWVRFLRSERRDGGYVWSIIHRSFADFLAGKVNLPAAHRRVARYYLQVWGGWEAGLPDVGTASGLHGGYGLRYLAKHLNSAAWWEPLYALFKNETWMQMRVAVAGYLYDDYLSELELALQHAKAETRQQIEADVPPDSLAEVVRHGLIRTKVNLLAESHVPELVSRAMEVGLWTTARALSVANRMPDAEKRVQTLTLLMTLLEGDAREHAIAEILIATHEIWPVDNRVKALATLAPHLTSDLRMQVLSEALATAREMADEGSRVQALEVLAPHLRGDLLAEALEIAQEMEDTRARANALAALAPQLTGGLLEKALMTAWEIEGGFTRADVLRALVPQLTGAAREHALTECLVTTRKIQNQEFRARDLVELIPHLTSDLLPQALAMAREIWDEKGCAQALIVLAPRLTGTLLTEALAAARELGVYRVVTLAALAPQLAIDARRRVLTEALAGAQDIADDWYRAQALAALAPQLTGDLLADALALAREIRNAESRAETLAALALQLTGELRECVLAEALTVACKIENKEGRVETLVTLVPQFTGATRVRILSEALAAAWEMSSEGWCAKALVSLVPYLTNDLLAEALAGARDFAGDSYRAQVLAALAPQLTGDLLVEALAAPPQRPHELKWAQTLAALAPRLAIDARRRVLTEALAGAQDIADDWYRAQALAALAPQLTGDLLADALALAREIRNKESRAETLAALAPQLTGDARKRVLAEALAAERGTWGQVDFSMRALAALAPQLTGDLVVDALALVRLIKYPEHLTPALVALAPQLTGDLLAKGLAIAQKIVADSFRARALAALVPQFTGAARVRILSEALAAARELASGGLYRVETLAALAPQLTVDARRSVLAEALAEAREIADDWYRARDLAVLAPQLTGDLLAEGLAAAREIGDGYARAQALAALAPQLTGDLLAEGLAAAREIVDEYARAQALAALLSLLCGPETRIVKRLYRTAILEVLGDIAHLNCRWVLHLLSDIDTFNSTLLGLTPKAVETIATAVVDVWRHWRWV